MITGPATPPDTVTIPFAEYQQLVVDAGAWRKLWASPHCAEIIAEYFEWLQRAEFRAIGRAISAAGDWRREATVPTFAELEKRRNHYDRPAETPAQIRARCAWSWRAYERAADRGSAA